MENVTHLYASNSKEYKMETICDNEIYARESENQLQLGFYYLVLWKRYSKEKKI